MTLYYLKEILYLPQRYYINYELRIMHCYLAKKHKRKKKGNVKTMPF